MFIRKALKMEILKELAAKYKTLSIIGMAKNAGKTTALNFLIEEAMDEGLKIGVTSTGRDGEMEDLVTGTEKPRVYLDQDMLVSVPSQLYELADAGLEILRTTPYSTAIGELLICRVQDAGYVQVAGPVMSAETKKLTKDMLDLGCEMILIDGAIDRKSVANPDTSDAVILSTGAVLSRKMDKVIEETSHVVNLYNLPELEEGKARDAIKSRIQDDKILMVSEDGAVRALNLVTSLGGAKVIDKEIKEDTKYVFIPGAFTMSVVEHIAPSRLKGVEFILKDPTRIFINPMNWGIMRKRGLRVRVLKNIEIAAITVNPWAPSGYTFDNVMLVNEMQKAIPDIPVIDVRM